LKPEWWGSPLLAQEGKYQGEENVIIIIMTIIIISTPI
jgi:hypothetical protein